MGKARAMELDEDKKVTAADQIAGAKQAEIEKLQIKLKDTTSEKKMVKIFDKINKERAEKKTEKERKKTEAREEEQTKETNDAMSKTNELARKQIDKVEAVERKKTLAAEKEADNLKATLLKFMKHAHDRLFSAGAKAQFAADKKAAKAKRDAMTAEEEHKNAALAKKTADEKLDAAATKLKGIMKEIAMGSGDATVLTKLAQKAQEAKSNVVAAKAAKRAAAQTLAEKTQALAIVKAKAGEKEKVAEKADAKAAKEARADKKAAEKAGASWW